MYSLIFAGSLLEPILGTRRFVVAYILTGFTSSALSLYMHPEIVSADASGAIFGLFGVLIAMLTTNLLHKQVRKTILPNLAILVAYNLVRGMAPGIDNAGHIGGFIGGLISGYSYYFSIREHASAGTKYIITAVLCLGTAAAVTASIMSTRNPEAERQAVIDEYMQKMQRVSELNSRALEFYSSDRKSKQDSLTEIKEKGIDNLDECSALLDSIEKMELPRAALERNEILKQYCALRKEAYCLIYRQVKERTNIYQSKIDALNVDIDSVVALLGEEQEADN
jgi:rhomboid protease GluP